MEFVSDVLLDVHHAPVPTLALPVVMDITSTVRLSVEVVQLAVEHAHFQPITHALPV